MPTLVNVVGMDEQRLTPDMAIVSLGVQTTGTTVAEASNANNELMTAVIAAVKAAGIEDTDIQSTSIGLSPVYAQPSRDDPNAPPTITGYRATNYGVRAGAGFGPGRHDHQRRSGGGS